MRLNRRDLLRTAALGGLAVGVAAGAYAVNERAPEFMRQWRGAAAYKRRRATEPFDRWPPPADHEPAIDRPEGPAYSLVSPDGRMVATVTIDSRAPLYELMVDGKPVIHPSRLGIDLRPGGRLQRGLVVVEERRRSQDAVWEQPWGEERQIRDRHHEMVLVLREQGGEGRWLELHLRLFDDGLALRYVLPAVGHLEILDERTEFVLGGDPLLWWLPAYGFARDEYLYRCQPLYAVRDEPRGRALHTPLTVRTENGLTLCFHEAALVDYAGMNLAPQPGGMLRCDLTPWSDGVKVRCNGTIRTPWRTVQVGRRPVDLINSRLILNLNDPPAIDPAPFKPGKYVGVWWGYILNIWGRVPGPYYGATTARCLDYIDFAARHGFDGVLIESWNQGWDQWPKVEAMRFTEPSSGFDEAAVLARAKAKGVHLVGHAESGGDISHMEKSLPEITAGLSRWGAKVVKTGYVAPQPGLVRRLPDGTTTHEWHYSQFSVNHHALVTEAMARLGIAVIAHEGVKDTGLRRTWPNLFSRECARGQEFNAFDVADGGNPPEHEATLAFTRLLSGPMDFTPGIFDPALKRLRGWRGLQRRLIYGRSRVNTTLAKQLALYVVIHSPMQMAADLIENYEGHPAFQFIKDVPVDWETSIALEGEVGRHVVMARQQRGGRDWYIGAIGDGRPLDVEVDLGFLEEGVTYEATIYGDAPDADWQENPDAWKIWTTRVGAGDQLLIRLAPGGGQAIRLIPLS